MKISLWCIGKTKLNYIKEGEVNYIKQISRYAPFNIEYLSSAQGKSIKQIDQYKNYEAEKILKKLKAHDRLILLDEKGIQQDSVKQAGWLQSQMESGASQLIFVIGGAHGFSEELYTRCHACISMSKWTMPHQLARIVFLEQLYRSFNIIKGTSYHHP